MWSFNTATGFYQKFPVKWYFAPPGAVPLGIRHQYGSLNYARGVAYPDQVGEVIGDARTWSNGAAQAGAVGTNHCGTNDQWVGRLDRLHAQAPIHPWGTLACCDSPRPCGNCPNSIMANEQLVHIEGGTGPFAVFNGDTVLNFNTTCHYNRIIAGNSWGMLIFAGPQVQLSLVASGGVAGATYQLTSPTWDCFGQLGPVPLVSSTGPGAAGSVSFN